MLINIGFDITLGVTAPTALLYMLRVHPSRQADLLAPESLQVWPNLQRDEYIDGFGNNCGRLIVPLGVSSVT